MIKKSHIASLQLQFLVNSCFTVLNIFNTKLRSKIVIRRRVYQFYLNFSTVSDQIAKWSQKFFIKYENSDDILCTTVHPTL